LEPLLAKLKHTIVHNYFFRYSGPLLEDGTLTAALAQGPESLSFTGVVSWLASELGAFVGLEERVSAVTCKLKLFSF
jgi:hypothetical protein